MIKNNYFYKINFNSERDKQLCDLEMKCIFGKTPSIERNILSNIDTSPSRSPYIKEKISIEFSSNTLEELEEKIRSSKRYLEDFKVIYVKSGSKDVSYKDRLKAINIIASSIEGRPNIHNPKIVLGISKVDTKWIFGIYEKNNCLWHKHNKRPYSYSNALPLTLAKALVNIAIGNDYSKTLVDPCCGVGTVVIEALDLGVRVKGYELNSLIASNAKGNLEYFGFENVIEEKDMHTINDEFDVAILDMPYDLFTTCSELDQNRLIESVYKIANKLVIVTNRVMNEELIRVGYKIIDSCSVSKNKFIRYVTVCKRDCSI